MSHYLYQGYGEARLSKEVFEEPYSAMMGRTGVRREIPHVVPTPGVGGLSGLAASALNSAGSIHHRAGLPDSDSRGGGGLVGEASVAGTSAGAFLEKNNQQPLLGGSG